MVLVASACFGTLAIFGKFAEAAGLNTTTLLTYRFIIGAGLIWLGLVLWRRARLLPKSARRTALGLGFLYAAFSALFFWGLLFVPAGVAGLAFYTYPVYVYVLSVTLLDESLSGQALVALVLALGGVALILGGNTGGADAFGVVLVLLAGLGYAMYITGSRAALASIDADILAGTAMIATAVSFTGFGIVSGRLAVPTAIDQWLIIVGIAAIGTAIPIFLYVTGLDRIPASRASIVSTSEPVVTVLLGIVLLGEALTAVLAIGGILVLTGVGLIQNDLATQRKAAQ